jgi:putative hydrolase of the HAD superfamily
VSNAQACFTKDELDELGITPLFDGILISSDAGVKKPDPEIFEIAFKKFNLNKDECFYVGNDLHDDVLGASNAGLKTVYIETEQSGKYPNLDITPNYEVNTHEEMKELLYNLAVKNK